MLGKKKEAPFMNHEIGSANTCLYDLAAVDHRVWFSRMVLSPTVLAHLEKAATRAARVANADAGLEEAVEVPNHPSKRKQESLEKAKEASRRELSKMYWSR